jgi:hypothetical protein
MKISVGILTFCLFFMGCNLVTKSDSKNNSNRNKFLRAADRRKKEKKNVDTARLLPYRGTQNKPLGFDDNNSLSFQNGVKINAVLMKDDSYSLKITRSAKIIFSIDSIKGVSKVLLDSNKLFFSVFYYVDEDGNNEGYSYIVDIDSNIILKYPVKLKNTCNPVVYKNCYFFLDSGKLIQTTLSLQYQHAVNINYCNSKKNYEFLDTYSINGLSKYFDSKEIFQIIFTPDKSSTSAKTYEGEIFDSTKTIVLEDKK